MQEYHYSFLGYMLVFYNDIRCPCLVYLHINVTAGCWGEEVAFNGAAATGRRNRCSGNVPNVSSSKKKRSGKDAHWEAKGMLPAYQEVQMHQHIALTTQPALTWFQFAKMLHTLLLTKQMKMCNNSRSDSPTDMTESSWPLLLTRLV